MPERFTMSLNNFAETLREAETRVGGTSLTPEEMASRPADAELPIYAGVRMCDPGKLRIECEYADGTHTTITLDDDPKGNKLAEFICRAIND